jgi:hypothetical protein
MAGRGAHLQSGRLIDFIERPGEDFTYAQADTVVNKGDLLIDAGKTDLVEQFAAEASS